MFQTRALSILFRLPSRIYFLVTGLKNTPTIPPTSDVADVDVSLVIVAGLAVAEDVAGAFKMEGPQGWNVREHPRTRRGLNLWRAVGGLEVVE
jgi:hypothetical protein